MGDWNSIGVAVYVIIANLIKLLESDWLDCGAQDFDCHKCCEWSDAHMDMYGIAPNGLPSPA